jgi:ACS family tartrate transporter-like MFS transporter
MQNDSSPQASAPASSTDQGRRVLARVQRRFIPFAFICYVVAYIDRVNVGFVATELQTQLGIGATGYGVAAGLFFLGYCLFEIPSNLILERVGARRWIARIMIGWGLVSMATMFVWDGPSFMVARVVLGIAEAGFFPGMVLFMTYWFPASERAKTGALFMMASPIAVIIGAPLSMAILRLDGAFGLEGWQWLFLIEGAPAVILGVLALFVLTDRPEDARWLSTEDRGWLVRTMAEDRAARQATGITTVRHGLMNAQLWLLCGVFFLNSIVNYGIFLWLPKLLEDVTGAEGFTLSAITSVPFIVALGAMVLVGKHSDRTGERRWYVAGCALANAVGLLVAVSFQQNIWLLVLGFTISQMALRSLAGVFWAMPPALLGGAAAAAGIALINSLGNIGGFVGPSLIGWLLDTTGSYTQGLLALTVVLIAQALLVLRVRLPRTESAVGGRPS